MKVKLIRQNQAFHYEGENEDELKVQIDGSPSIGGEGKGARPMELLLMGLAGCASIDLGLILKKQRQELVDYQVEATGERKTDDGKAFKNIHLHFILFGELDEQKVEKAIALTLNKYCSVALSLNQEITISYTYRIRQHG